MDNVSDVEGKQDFKHLIFGQEEDSLLVTTRRTATRCVVVATSGGGKERSRASIATICSKNLAFVDTMHCASEQR
jgi:hypothetical protein